VDPSYVVEFITRWTPAVERTGATFFEATTAMAFDWFARAGVDVAVVETGLGGRLDATNVVRPLAAGVTSIGIDHVEYLGDTREAIAGEKAGIFKPGRPAVIGEPDPDIARRLVVLAGERGATPVIDVWREAPRGAHRPRTRPLPCTCCGPPVSPGPPRSRTRRDACPWSGCRDGSIVRAASSSTWRTTLTGRPCWRPR
jgi:dihydrofolate synthase/folylpolyglutamate synthase